VKTNVYFFIIARSLLLRRKYVSENLVEKIKTHNLCSVTFFRKSCHLWDDVEKYLEPATPQMTKWLMRIACWIPKATNTYSYHVILIAFPLQRWLHDRVSVLRFTYIACLFNDESRWTCSSPNPINIIYFHSSFSFTPSSKFVL